MYNLKYQLKNLIIILLLIAFILSCEYYYKEYIYEEPKIDVDAIDEEAVEIDTPAPANPILDEIFTYIHSCSCGCSYSAAFDRVLYLDIYSNGNILYSNKQLTDRAFEIYKMCRKLSRPYYDDLILSVVNAHKKETVLFIIKNNKIIFSIYDIKEIPKEWNVDGFYIEFLGDD